MDILPNLIQILPLVLKKRSCANNKLRHSFKVGKELQSVTRNKYEFLNNIS